MINLVFAYFLLPFVSTWFNLLYSERCWSEWFMIIKVPMLKMFGKVFLVFRSNIFIILIWFLERILQGLRVAQSAVTIYMHISSSYAKILGETNFHTWEIPRSGSKAEDGEEEKKRTSWGWAVPSSGKVQLSCVKLYVRFYWTSWSIWSIRSQEADLKFQIWGKLKLNYQRYVNFKKVRF